MAGAFLEAVWLMDGTGRPLNFHVRKLVRELIRLRQEAGLIQKDVFRTTRMTPSKMSRFEVGIQVPKFLETQALLDLYGVPVCDWKYYQDIRDRAAEKPWWEGKGLQDVALISDEHEARVVRDVQLMYLPVLLRTEAYARRLLETTSPSLDDERLAMELEACVRRGKVLDGDDPVYLHALIYQPVLQSGVDVEQLRHLRDLAARPNVTVQIITHPTDPRSDMKTSFTLVSFPDKEDPDVAYTEGLVGPAQTEDAKQVGALRSTFENLVKFAMSPEESLTHLNILLERARDEAP
ncbi:helix-turn-helix domain-containing protein [Kibdelosporangium philippinense]|uniref:helix-turn-helix domain-containing protein n=1 Tax=Kibdelosporangium philippinense TaxID=211113 RepID=UPI003612E613